MLSTLLTALLATLAMLLPAQAPPEGPPGAFPASLTALLPAQGDAPLPPSSDAAPAAPQWIPADARSGIRGAWVRPDARPAPAVLDTLRARGYTDVFLESFYHGMTVYPSGVAPHNPEFAGRDVLREYLDAASARGMRVHAWLEVLYWQPPLSTGNQGGLLGQHRDWETLSAQGRRSQDGPHGMGFADPGVYAVRQTVYALAAELARRYPQVGLHLDYLRYPAGDEYGYHPDALAAFKAQSGGQYSRVSPSWFSFRQDLLTQVANGMSRSYHAAGGLGVVSAAVNASYPFYKTETLQVWPRWTGVDVFVPMAYSANLGYLRLLSRYVRYRSPRPLWLGLLVGPGYPDLTKQLRVLEEEGFSNFVAFGVREE